MFAHDGSLRFIDASEEEILSVHRSEGALTLELEGLQKKPVEAYLCLLRRGDSLRLHAAFHVSGTRSTCVYSDPRPVDASRIPGAVREGLSFLEKIGFRMTEVNLKYGKAMRGVVVRDLKIFTPPDSPRGAQPAKAAAPKPPAPAEVKTAPPPPPAGAQEGRTPAGGAVTEAAFHAATAALRAENEKTLEELSRLREELVHLREQATKAEDRAAEAELDVVATRGEALEAIAREAALRSELARATQHYESLTKGVDERQRQLACESTRLEKQVERLQGDLAASAAREEALRVEGERLAIELRAAGAAAGMEKELRREVARLTEGLRQKSEEAAGTEALLEREKVRHAGEIDAREREHLEKTAALQKEVARLATELEAADRGRIGEGPLLDEIARLREGKEEIREAWRRRLARAGADLIPMRRKIEDLTRALAAADGERAGLRAEAARLAEENERLVRERAEALARAAAPPVVEPCATTPPPESARALAPDPAPVRTRKVVLRRGVPREAAALVHEDTLKAEPHVAGIPPVGSVPPAPAPPTAAAEHPTPVPPGLHDPALEALPVVAAPAEAQRCPPPPAPLPEPAVHRTSDSRGWSDVAGTQAGHVSRNASVDVSEWEELGANHLLPSQEDVRPSWNEPVSDFDFPAFAELGEMGGGLPAQPASGWDYKLAPGAERSGGRTLQLFRSLNMVRLNHSGRPENCSGEVTVTEHALGTDVEVVFISSDNGRHYLYRPSRRPAGAGECAEATRSAVAFAEEVGFMMTEAPCSPPPDDAASGRWQGKSETESAA